MKYQKLLFLLLTVSVLAVGCSSEALPEQVSLSGDLTSTEVEIAERIVSLSPTATEILFSIDAGSQVVAVDDQSNYPVGAPITDLSGYTPNVEAIASYSPDLVVISYDPGDLVSGLVALGIAVVVQPAAETFSDTYGQISELGKLTGHTNNATELVESIETDLAEMASSQVGNGLTYYHEVDNTFYTTTSSTFLGQLYALLGLSNIADPADEVGFGWPQLSAEFIIDSDPDLIFLGNVSWGESAETVTARPGWQTMKAIRNGGIIAVDTDMSGRWGPRIVDYLTAVKTAIEERTD